MHQTHRKPARLADVPAPAHDRPVPAPGPRRLARAPAPGWGPSADAPASGLSDALAGVLADAVRNRSGVRVIQREVATRAKDFDKLMSAGGRIAPARSAFGSLRTALAKYHSAKNPEAKVAALHALQDGCVAWLNDHAGGNDRTDVARRSLVSRLSDEVATEQAARSRTQGQDRYYANAKARKIEEDPYALVGMTRDAKTFVGNKLAKPAGTTMRQFGLTRAEVAAIQTFTLGDYKYINPTTANSPGWLAAQRSRSPDWKVGDDVLRQEGPLHAAVAMQGMAKLPAYEGTVYRGASYTQAEFAALQQNDVWTTAAMASASKDLATAELFAYTSASPTDDTQPPKTHAVLYEISDSGGRDIDALSLLPGEREVLLMAGSSYLIRSLETIEPPAMYRERPADAEGRRNPIGQWWRATLGPVPTSLAPSPAV